MTGTSHTELETFSTTLLSGSSVVSSDAESQQTTPENDVLRDRLPEDRSNANSGDNSAEKKQTTQDSPQTLESKQCGIKVVVAVLVFLVVLVIGCIVAYSLNDDPCGKRSLANSNSQVGKCEQIFSTSQRPGWMLSEIALMAEFNAETEWSFNGAASYGIGGIDEQALAHQLVIDGLAKKRTDFYFMDVGCGEFKWGEALSNYLNSKFDSCSGIPAVTVHLVGLHGGPGPTGANGEPTKNGCCKIHTLSLFAIENFRSLRKSFAVLANTFDLVVSRSTFQHLVDARGTYLDIYEVVRHDGFIIVDQNNPEVIGSHLGGAMYGDSDGCIEGARALVACGPQSSGGQSILIGYGESAKQPYIGNLSVSVHDVGFTFSPISRETTTSMALKLAKFLRPPDFGQNGLNDFGKKEGVSEEAQQKMIRSKFPDLLIDN